MTRWTIDGLAFLLVLSSTLSLQKPLAPRQDQSFGKPEVRHSEVAAPCVDLNKFRGALDLYLDVPLKEPVRFLSALESETTPTSSEIVHLLWRRSRSPPLS